MQDDKKAFKQYKEQSMTFVGKLIYHTRAAHYYRDGTFFSLRLKWWHPASWFVMVYLVLILIPVCMFTDITVKEWWKEVRDTFRVKQWFKDNPERMSWYDPYRK